MCQQLPHCYECLVAEELILEPPWREDHVYLNSFSCLAKALGTNHALPLSISYQLAGVVHKT